MIREEWVKTSLILDEVLKRSDNKDLPFVKVVTFTVDAIIITTRPPTRADLPKSEVEQFKLAAREFKELYQFEYGIVLTDVEASKKALSMLQLFDVLTSDESEILT